MGLCKGSCDLARNSGKATAAVAPFADPGLFWQLLDRLAAHFPLHRKHSLCLSAATRSISTKGKHPHVMEVAPVACSLAEKSFP